MLSVVLIPCLLSHSFGYSTDTTSTFGLRSEACHPYDMGHIPRNAPDNKEIGSNLLIAEEEYIANFAAQRCGTPISRISDALEKELCILFALNTLWEFPLCTFQEIGSNPFCHLCLCTKVRRRRLSLDALAFLHVSLERSPSRLRSLYETHIVSYDILPN